MNNLACIGCGCDDDHACVDIEGVACFWVRQDPSAGLGVCSHCYELTDEWDAGRRTAPDLVDDDDSTLILPGDDDFDSTLELAE